MAKIGLLRYLKLAPYPDGRILSYLIGISCCPPKTFPSLLEIKKSRVKFIVYDLFHLNLLLCNTYNLQVQHIARMFLLA